MGAIARQSLVLASISIMSLTATWVEAGRPGTITFNLPSQTLGASLRAVAARTRLNIAAPSERVDRRQAPALSGDYTASEALARLLKGTGLHAEQVGGTIIVRTDTGVAASDDAAKFLSREVGFAGL